MAFELILDLLGLVTAASPLALNIGTNHLLGRFFERLRGRHICVPVAQPPGRALALRIAMVMTNELPALRTTPLKRRDFFVE
jgi:hypothetical protein